MGLFDKLFGKEKTIENATEKAQQRFEEEFNQAMEVYHKEGLAACKSQIDKLSKAGCIKATLFIRERLLEGIATFASESEKVTFQNAANNLLRIAADQGDVVSQFVTGTMFESGNFFPKNPATAMHYYKLAAEANHPKAQNNLALCYMEGKGTDVDYKASIHWLEMSAKQNNPRAFLNLGYQYRFGKGVAVDLDRARDYYYKAINAANDLLTEMKYGTSSPYYESTELNDTIDLANKYLSQI